MGAGVPFTASTGQSTQIHLDWYSGNWGSLVPRAGRLLEEYRELLPVASEISLVLGCLAVARGDWDEAGRHLAESGVRSVENSITPGREPGRGPVPAPGARCGRGDAVPPRSARLRQRAVPARAGRGAAAGPGSHQPGDRRGAVPVTAQVEQHVARVLRKLGVTSRGALAT